MCRRRLSLWTCSCISARASSRLGSADMLRWRLRVGIGLLGGANVTEAGRAATPRRRIGLIRTVFRLLSWTPNSSQPPILDPEKTSAGEPAAHLDRDVGR